MCQRAKFKKQVAGSLVAVHDEGSRPSCENRVGNLVKTKELLWECGRNRKDDVLKILQWEK